MTRRCAPCAAPNDGPVRRYCSQAARGIRCGQRQFYHRCHRRLPGETEDDFEASMAFVTGMRFLKVHVFPTPAVKAAAFDFADQLPEHEKARSRRMTAAVEEVRAAEAAAMQGRKASVLLETPLSATMFTGYTKRVPACAGPAHPGTRPATLWRSRWVPGTENGAGRRSFDLY